MTSADTVGLRYPRRKPAPVNRLVRPDRK